MWALKVIRSTIAATRRGSLKTEPHSLNGRVGPTLMLARSSRSVMIWKSSSAPGVDLDVAQLVEQQQVQSAVATHDAGELSFVGGFGEFVDQRGCGGVADSAALFAGGQAQADE